MVHVFRIIAHGCLAPRQKYNDRGRGREQPLTSGQQEAENEGRARRKGLGTRHSL